LKFQLASFNNTGLEAGRNADFFFFATLVLCKNIFTANNEQKAENRHKNLKQII
jgi:hypothetical protein